MFRKKTDKINAVSSQQGKQNKCSFFIQNTSCLFQVNCYPLGYGKNQSEMFARAQKIPWKFKNRKKTHLIHL